MLTSLYIVQYIMVDSTEMILPNLALEAWPLPVFSLIISLRSVL